ncbi:MAG: methyl-accepting chemotaxis protein [Acidobacteriota bacterium]|nr:methyl-accepting chemotaxis protein [Acidobacteriota bacterium]
MNNLVTLIEHFIPDRLRADAALHTRARFMVSYLFIMAGLGLVYNLVYFKVGNNYGGAVIVGMVCVIIYLPFYLRKTGNLVMTMHLCGIFLTVMMGTIMVTSGGAVFSGNPWWTLTPVFATLVAGGKAGRTWFLLVAGIVGGAYVLELFGFRFPDLMDRENELAWVRFLDWFHYFGVIFVLTVGALVFDYINAQALKGEAATRQEVEKAGREVERQNKYLDESVAEILREMEKLANGDLTARLEVKKDDAIGQLCQGFNLAVERMQEAVTDVSQAVEVTAYSSEMIDNSTDNLRGDAQRQTEKAGLLADSTSQIVSLISENAGHARTTAEAASRNGELATEGGEIVRETVKKMEDIAAVVNGAADSIKALGSSTGAIGNIVGVISDIAERTNLLALNAAIEAAHAGSLGQGFGVIAEEVKDLASKTTVETDRIAQMIKKVQEQTGTAIDRMKTGNDQVEAGKELATRAGEALERIVDSSGHVGTLIQQIADACEEQTGESERLFSEIEEMRKVTDDSAGEIGGIAQSATKLGGLTRELQDLLTRFNLSET